MDDRSQSNAGAGAGAPSLWPPSQANGCAIRKYSIGAMRSQLSTPPLQPRPANTLTHLPPGPHPRPHSRNPSILFPPVPGRHVFFRRALRARAGYPPIVERLLKGGAQISHYCATLEGPPTGKVHETSCGTTKPKEHNNPPRWKQMTMGIVEKHTLESAIKLHTPAWVTGAVCEPNGTRPIS